MTPEMRAMIQSLYPTGQYRDLDEHICKQYFNNQRAEAYALRDKIGAIPGGEWFSWDSDEEMMRSRTVRMYAPSDQYVGAFSVRPKADRIGIISKEHGGLYAPVMSLHMSNVGPFYSWSWVCHKVLPVGREAEIESVGTTSPPNIFWQGVANRIKAIMTEHQKTMLTREDNSEVVPWIDVRDTELDDINEPATVYHCFFEPIH